MTKPNQSAILMVSFKCSANLALTFGVAATRCELSRHAWIIEIIDCAAGLIDKPPEMAPGTAKPRRMRRPARGDGEMVQLSVRVDRAKGEAWAKAAAAAGMPRQPWVALLLAVAVDGSALPGQLDRIRFG